MFNIKVNPNSFTPTLITLTRNIIIVVCSGSFTLSDDDVTKVATGIVSVGLTLYGAWKAYHTNEEKKTMEPFVPDAIATTK